MLINGRKIELSLAYCERTPSREMVERAGQAWTEEKQAAWDEHQTHYARYLRMRAQCSPIDDVDTVDLYIAKHPDRLFVNGPLESCDPVDLTVLDAYGGKLRAGELPGQGWKIQHCLVCGALCRAWPVPD
jgi:hypothetical protein